MKKTTKKKATKKKVVKKAVSKPKKAAPAKFNFTDFLSTATNGKGKVYIKIAGPDTWKPGTRIKRDDFAEIDYSQFNKPDNADKAELYPGECWAEYTLTKIVYSSEPDDITPIDYTDSESPNIYNGGH